MQPVGATCERPGEMISVTEVAKRFGVNPATVRLWIRSGELPARAYGNMYFIRPDDVVRIRPEL